MLGKDFIGHNTVKVELKNKGTDELALDQLQVKVEITDANIEFGSNGKTLKHGVKYRLSELTTGGTTTLKTSTQDMIELQLQSNLGKAKNAHITLIVEDSNGAEIGKAVIKWENIKLAITGPASFMGNDEVEITIKNEGAELSTDDLALVFNSTENDIEFLIGSNNIVKHNSTKPLTALATKKKIAVNGIERFSLKLHNAHGKRNTNITLKALDTKNGNIEVGTSNPIVWEAQEVKLTVQTSIASGELLGLGSTCSFSLHNLGTTSITPYNIKCKVKVDSKATFQIGDMLDVKDGDEITLKDILDTYTAIGPGTNVNFMLSPRSWKKDEVGLHTTINLQFEYDGEILHKQDIKCIYKNFKFLFKAYQQVFDGDRFAPFELDIPFDQDSFSRTAPSVLLDDLDDIKVYITTTNGVIFNIWSEGLFHERITSGQELALKDILHDFFGKKLDKNPTNIGFSLQIDDDKGQVESNITVVIKYAGYELGRKEIIWKKS